MQTKPKDAPLILSAPMDAEVSIPASYTDYTAAVVKEASAFKTLVYPDQEGLTAATRHLSAMKDIIDEVEDVEEKLRKPVNAWLKAIRKLREDFLTSVRKEHLRITGLTNHHQRKRIEDDDKRKREAIALQYKAEEEARKAEAALSSATNEDDKLDAQLAMESAELAKEKASAQLAIPTDTPKGLATRVRFDFEITSPTLCLGGLKDQWTWKADDETYKFNRAGFLKLLNADEPQPLIAEMLPMEGTESRIPHCGIRIFRDVSTHTR